MRALARLTSACLFLFSTQLYAQTDELLTRIAGQLDKHAVVRAEFSQSKQISGLKRPLQTSGQLIFSRQHGVLWQIEQPYKVGYILGEDKVVEIGADGSRSAPASPWRETGTSRTTSFARARKRGSAAYLPS